MLVLCFGLDFKSHRVCLCVCGGGGGGGGVLLHHGGVLTNKGSPPPLSNVLFSWDIRGNYSTKSKVAECVKRLYFGCKFLKHRSHGQTYTPGANCAYEPSLSNWS